MASQFEWIGKSPDGKTVTLKRLEDHLFQFPKYFTPDWEAANSDLVRIGASVDVETTGLSQERDQVIEIGIRQFKFNRSSGEILSLGKSYCEFQDPGVPLSAELTQLTGITDEMVAGKKIDLNQVNALLGEAHLIVAHNASFDRPFVDRISPASAEKVWGCSFKQIDWTSKGLTSQKLDILSIFHGFFNDAHRALNDSDSLLYLLSLQDQTLKTPYFLELMTNARKPMVNVIASNSPFESKDHLKGRSYRWDNQSKSWSKQIAKEQLAAETEWLEKLVYNGAFRGKTIEIQPADQFKGN